MSPLKEMAAQTINFFLMQGRRNCNMGIFGSPCAPVLFIDETVQVKISLVSKPNSAHMDVAFINPLHHNISHCLSCFIEAGLRICRVWILSEYRCKLKGMTGYVDVGFIQIAAATRQIETRGRCCITCFTSLALPSVFGVHGRPTFPAHSPFMFPVHYFFLNRTFIVAAFGPLVTLNSVKNFVFLKKHCNLCGGIIT